MKKGMRRIGAALACLFAVCAPLYAQGGASDEAGIRDLIGQLSRMWTEPDGARIADSILARNVLGTGPQGSLSRSEYLQVISFAIAGAGVAQASHEVLKLKIVDNMAYERGIMRMKGKDGSESSLEIFNIFVKENGAWKFFGSVLGFVLDDLFG
jgi:hypothetical protein